MGMTWLRVFAVVWLALAFVGLFAGAEIWYAFMILSGVNSTATIVVGELKGEREEFDDD